ncbi:MAG: hypothetical protein Hyperionvirus2_211 [Hyperionvirus sp.]|uniref:Uncharacterized protein n=1 Tax=Hyperionvirus sp. TaxID=2487770 RepID=A0A3G5AAH1_9VIRU|nr:MAG: hypothetical protein Hyperionvirus2_211 [Hyperionvirus sp.]
MADPKRPKLFFFDKKNRIGDGVREYADNLFDEKNVFYLPDGESKITEKIELLMGKVLLAHTAGEPFCIVTCNGEPVPFGDDGKDMNPGEIVTKMISGLKDVPIIVYCGDEDYAKKTWGKNYPNITITQEYSVLVDNLIKFAKKFAPKESEAVII